MTILTFTEGRLDPGLCPNCHVHASFFTESSAYVWPTYLANVRDIGGHASAVKPRWVLQNGVRCRHCDKTVVLQRVRLWNPDGSWETEDVRQVWPLLEPRTIADSAPSTVRELFLEGARSEAARAYRAAGAMYRAAVEELCKDRGAEGPNLFKKIEDLVNRGVSREIVDDLHEARFLGNWSLHDGLEFSAEEVGDVAELITEAVHVLYVQPEERRAMRDARKARRDAFSSRP
ncbi:DUF4145 domain-containing protein [Kitasatospora sp. NPDC002965]|uniref:DUF4145 domain-containing protein n=1 Tax=Kitasatospora sp. NPDC002965 TaxID=3154775 RepID=UPI0033AE755C